ncbi:hypothetical protein K456DRAFT_1720060 [Colletotrichum gloeosporioides 23]|nr:hypothetical protein K456DRAFT_1720060 [Colletotrichum gloeosporioides 23]
MHEVFASRATYDFGTVYDTLQHDWRTVERLSVTNRRLRRCIADSGCLYRTLIVKGDSIWRIVSLLWSLKKNPAMGPAVRMLYMGLAFEVYPKEGSLPPPQQYHLNFVLKMATACNVQYPAELSFSTAPVPSDSLHCEWTSLLAGVILAKMTNIEDIGIKTVSRVFRGMEPPSTSFFKGPSLPNLRFEPRQKPLRRSRGPPSIPAPKFKSLTTITLNGCPVNEQELARMLDHCTLVSVFRYIMPRNSALAIAPDIVVEILQRRHAKSLRTLCIHVFSRIWGLGEISTLESFDNLESLWIDLGSIDN